MSEGEGQEASRHAADVNRNVALQAYGVGLPALRAQHGAINEGMAMGESAYMRDAYGGARTGIMEAISGRGAAGRGAADMGARQMVQGGNAASILSPQDIGSQLADALMGNRTSEAMGNIEQTNKLLADAIGMGSSAGNRSVAAGGQQLDATSMMAQYDPTYAAIVGAGNLGGTIYGAGKKAGWWQGGSGAGSTGTPLPMGWSSASVVP